MIPARSRSSGACALIGWTRPWLRPRRCRAAAVAPGQAGPADAAFPARLVRDQSQQIPLLEVGGQVVVAAVFVGEPGDVAGRLQPGAERRAHLASRADQVRL